MISRPVLFERFAGRETEFGTLVELWERCTRESSGFTVLIDGEAGVGKSRLLEEFAHHVERRRGMVAASTCDESVQFAYAPLIHTIDAIVKKRAARNSLELAGARRRLTDPLPTSSGPHMSALAQRYTAVVDALSDVAARSGSLCVVIDDLQWSDASSLDLLRYLARELTAAPLLFLLAYRHEDTAEQRFAEALAKIERERVYRLHLAPLAEDEIRMSIVETLGTSSLPQKTISRISELAEGKPFFAEELLRSALEHGPNGARENVAPPTSLRAAVLQRVDRLAAADREVLANAAVIGRTFAASLLVRLMGASQTEILRALRAARNAQIVRETSAGRYEFRHAITREILYSEFLDEETRELHTRIADQLATEPERASLLGEIAYHRWMARDGERSAAANEAAADEAARLSAYNDALKFLERALDTVNRRSPVGAALSEKAARAAMMVGDVQRARVETESAIEAVRAFDDRAAARRLMLWSARQRHLSGEHAEALAMIAEVKRELRNDPGDSANLIAADIAYALIIGTDRPSEALATTDRILASGTRLTGDDAFRFFHARGAAHVALGAHDAAIEDYEHAERLAAETGDTYRALSSANNRAAAAGYAGRYAVAKRAYEDALERANATGIENSISLLAANAAFWELLLGDVERAAKHAAAANTRRASDHAVVLATSVSIRIASLAGDASTARMRRAQENLARAAALDNNTIVCIAAGAAALDLINDGRFDDASSIVSANVARINEFDPTAFWLTEAAARAGDDASKARVRSLLAAATHGSADAIAGYRAYFEVLSAARSGGGVGVYEKHLARQAHEAFERSGLTYETARCAELSGNQTLAKQLFRTIGASGEERRVDGVAPEQPRSAAALTRREEQIARLASRGLSNREIAAELRIGERTVETHVAHVYAKLRLKTRAELALHFASQS